MEEMFRERASLEAPFDANWKGVKGWSEEARYWPDIPEDLAVGLYGAIVDAEYGVLPCIKKWW